jgi:RNA polymerase sigma-70 factor (ECF subfamily)
LIAVAKKIPEFTYDPAKDSFKGWLLQILRWRITDQHRKKISMLKREGSDGLSTATDAAEAAAIADPTVNLEAIWEAEWQQEVLKSALAKVKRQVKPEQYAIYHLHVIEEHSVSEVRRLLSVSTAQVYLAKHRVGRLLKGAIKTVQAEL